MFSAARCRSALPVASCQCSNGGWHRVDSEQRRYLLLPSDPVVMLWRSARLSARIIASYHTTCMITATPTILTPTPTEYDDSDMSAPPYDSRDVVFDRLAWSRPWAPSPGFLYSLMKSGGPATSLSIRAVSLGALCLFFLFSLKSYPLNHQCCATRQDAEMLHFGSALPLLHSC